MDSGLAFVYSSLAFPRYHFFQARLQRLIPRLQNILEAGGLPDCVSQGKIKLKEISFAAQDITDRVTVNLFADNAVLKKQTFDLPEQNDTIGKVKIEDLQWIGYVKGLKDTSFFHPSVTVMVTQSAEKVHHICYELTEEQREGVILYNDHTKAAVQYTSLAFASQYSESMEVDQASPQSMSVEADLDKTSQQSKSVEHDLDKTSQQSKSVERDLVQQVQFVLEGKVIRVFEMIAGYIQEFIPRRGEEVDSSLTDAIHVSLIESLKSSYVVKDLSPNTEAILGAKTLTEADIEIVSPYIAREWETVATILGLSQLDIQRIKMESYTVMDRSSQVLRRWRSKEGGNASMDYLLKLLKEIKIDVSSIESTFLSLSPDVVKDKIFKKKLTDFVINKTKCVVCDTLSKKYGISAFLLNEFLNEGFFGYPTKVTEVLANMEMPKWPRDRTDDGVSTCRVFSYRCAMNLTKVMHSTEDYIKAKLSILVVLKKLQFELHGYLSQTKVPITTHVPDLPKLPLQLQYQLLSLEEVTGCGTCYGELLLHVRKTLSPGRKEEIKQLLKEYNYIDGYKSAMMSEQTEQTTPDPPVQHGQELRAQKSGGSQDYKYGSLGCFFNLRPKQPESNVSQQSSGAKVSTGYVITEAKDHCLTCAHCLKDCEVNVDTRVTETGYYHLGIKKCDMYEPEALDVASVQVADDRLPGCDSRLKNSEERYLPDWRVFDVDPIRRVVHKEGCKTGFTKGLVMSSDYMTERIKEYNLKKYRKSRENVEPFKPFKPSFNILIESLPADWEHIGPVLQGGEIEPSNGTPFSQEGDSGSVIIADEINNANIVNVVALLLGAVSVNNRFLHSYASLMRKTMEEVEVQYDCIATPSRLLPEQGPGEIGVAGAGAP